MKKVKLLKEQQHPKGNIPEGAIFNWNEENSRYEYSENGMVISTINEAGVNLMTDLFKRI
jgi:hypothetical protein